ncbi:MAG: YdeI family protein [Anaerolineales bacterium]
MTQPIPESKLLHITERDQWRAWLKKNYKSKDEIWLVYAKKHSGEPRISYNDAVEEALCFGWIDSIVKTIDDDRFAQRFSVRKSKSGYSQPNRERLRLLVEEGQIMPEVLETLPDLSEEDFKIAPDILEAIKANNQAWKNFQGFSEPYIRIRISYIDAGRERPEIFGKRLANFISKTEKNKLIGYGGIEKYY